MIVVFVFLQGFRATIIPMLAIPVSLIATFAAMAAFGFSLNSLTLCGLVLAIGLVVDDAIIVVENVEKFLRARPAPARGDARGDGRDHGADRDDHAGAGRRVRPGRVHPGADRPALQPVRHDDRLLVRLLGVQLAVVQPGDVAAVPPGQARRDAGSSSSAGSTPACDGSRTRTTRSSSSPPTTGGRSSSPRSPCWR